MPPCPLAHYLCVELVVLIFNNFLIQVSPAFLNRVKYKEYFHTCDADTWVDDEFLNGTNEGKNKWKELNLDSLQCCPESFMVGLPKLTENLQYLSDSLMFTSHAQSQTL